MIDDAERWFAIINGCAEFFGIKWHIFLILCIIFLLSLWFAEKMGYETGRVEQAEKDMDMEDKREEEGLNAGVDEVK